MKNRIWNIMMLVFWMQYCAHARLLLFDLANDDEYQEDKNKEGCNWEGRRKKCIPLFVVQTIFEIMILISQQWWKYFAITLLKNVTFAFFTQNWVLWFKHFPLSLSSLCEHNLDYLSAHCALWNANSQVLHYAKSFL